MSNPKTAINEIKKLMVQFGFMTEEATPLSFKLEDDTIINTEKLEVGKSVSKINEAFEAVALEDGSYKLKENFEIEVSNGEITAVKEIFVEAKLKDGTVVKVEGDSLVEGAAVKVVTEEMPDGIAAPDGVHMLEDGTEVETNGGMIVSVKSPEGMMDGEMPEDSIDDGDPIQVELMKMLRDFIYQCGEKMSQMEQKMEAMNNEFSAFKKEPAGKKISDGKTEFNKINNSDDELDARVAIITALRNKK